MNNDLIIDIAKRVGAFSLIIIGILAMIFKEPIPIIQGFLFGTAISLIGLKLMDNTIAKAITKSPAKASTYTLSHYAMRFTVYTLALVLAHKADYLNFFSAAFGLTMVKNTIVISAIFNKEFK